MTAYVPPLARGDRSLVGNWFWQVDKPILMAVLALILTGVALSFASSPAAALRDDSISGDFYYAWRMIAFATLGLGILISTSMLSPRHVRRVSALTFLFCIGVMCLLPFFGNEAKGATRWLAIGPFGFQPSEFIKPALIVLAAWMFAEGQKGEGVPGMSLAFGLYGITAGLLIIQPDIGQTVLITTTFMAVFFMAGVPLRWMAALMGLTPTAPLSRRCRAFWRRRARSRWRWAGARRMLFARWRKRRACKQPRRAWTSPAFPALWPASVRHEGRTLKNPLEGRQGRITLEAGIDLPEVQGAEPGPVSGRRA